MAGALFVDLGLGRPCAPDRESRGVNSLIYQIVPDRTGALEAQLFIKRISPVKVGVPNDLKTQGWALF